MTSADKSQQPPPSGEMCTRPSILGGDGADPIKGGLEFTGLPERCSHRFKERRSAIEAFGRLQPNQELLEAIEGPLQKGLLTVTSDLNPFMLALERAFPFSGHRLAWERVPNTISETCPKQPGIPNTIATDAKAFAEFMARLVEEHHLTGTVAVLGDGKIDLAVYGEVADVVKHLPAIANFPQHTYVFPFPVATWCASLMMEGYMDFAHAPPEAPGK